MGTKKIAEILPPARKGSKRDWRTVTTELPPEQHERFMRLVVLDGRRRTDIAAEALIEWMDRQAA